MFLRLFGINAPLLFGQTFVVVVSPQSVVLSGLEQLFGFGRILFHDRCVANFSFQEIFELVPLRLFGVEREGVLALLFQFGVVTPQVPVSTFNGGCFFGLSFAHSFF